MLIFAKHIYKGKKLHKACCCHHFWLQPANKKEDLGAHASMLLLLEFFFLISALTARLTSISPRVYATFL